jgi:hypothetical protein
MKKLMPRPGYRAGELEFRFKRAGHTLAVDLSLPNGARWIMVAIHMPNGKPFQIAFSHHSIADCYLDAGGPIPLKSGEVLESDPSLVIGGTSFALRRAEYEALRDHLLEHGLVHHVRGDAALEAPAIRQQAPAPFSVDNQVAP